MRSKEQHDQRGVRGDCLGASVQSGLGRELEDWEALTWSTILHPSPVPQLTQGEGFLVTWLLVLTCCLNVLVNILNMLVISRLCYLCRFHN